MKRSVEFELFDWGQITERDKRLIDKGWRKFWLKRGSFPAWDDLSLANMGARRVERNKIDKV